MKQDSLHQDFQAVQQNVSSTTFQSPELLIQCGFIWKETMQLVSGNVEFNACFIAMAQLPSFFSPPSYAVYSFTGV